MKKYILMLLIAFLCVPAFGAEFLIYNKAHWMDALKRKQIDEYVKKYPNFMDKYDAQYQRGDVVEVRPDDYWTGTKAKNYRKDTFLLVSVPSVLFKDAERYGKPLLDENDKIIRKRKYNFSDVTDKQVFDSLLDVTITEKRIAKNDEKPNKYFAFVLRLFRLLLG